MIKSYSSSLRAQTFLENALEELDASGPEAALHRLRRMKQLLLRYHEEQKKLDRLGLDDMDEVFDAMRTMKERADRLEEQVEAYRTAQEKLDAIQKALDVGASAEQTVETIEGISEQLESLYEERELLSRAGVTDATEAVQLIQSMREQLDQVDGGMETEEDERASLDRLEDELGVSDSESVLDMIESMEDQLAAKYEAPADAPDAAAPTDESRSLLVRSLERQMVAAQTGEAEVPGDEGPPLVPPDRLDTLTERSPDELGALDVGVVVLDDDARVQLATEHVPPFPGLAGTPDGDSLFDRCPAARNPLLRAALRRAREEGAPFDRRFAFTIPRPDAPAPLPLILHLYRDSESGPTWLFYDRLR